MEHRTDHGTEAGAQAAPIPSAGEAGFRMPAEWEHHDAVWLAWPSHAELWQQDLDAARSEFVQLCRAIADVDPGTGSARGELLEVLVIDEHGRRQAAAALAGLPLRLHYAAFGDIWLRDTAPVFVRSAGGDEVAAVCFRFNGWGEKYLFPADLTVAREVRRLAAVHSFEAPLIFEGGSIEVDGEGTALTTRQCLLNTNRNPAMTRADIERDLADALGIERLLWLGDGLANDHTDGHVDTLARFCASTRVLCMQARDPNDPNRQVLARVAADLSEFRDARGRALEVVSVPSPGLVRDRAGEAMPASYLNFYVANTTVVVPTYGSPCDAEAVEKIGSCFPGRAVVGASARALLTGGGAFHCITQQQPAAAKARR